MPLKDAVVFPCLRAHPRPLGSEVAAAGREAVRRRRYPPVERLQPGREHRLVDFMARGCPVVIAAGDAAGRAPWGPEALRAAYGEHVVESEDPRAVYVDQRERRRRTVADVVDGILAGDTALRFKALDVFTVIPALGDLLATSPPPTDALLPAGTTRTRPALWLAPPRTSSSFHHDGNADNLNWQIHGEKLFVLAPPCAFAHVYPAGSAESPIDPFAPDLGRFPRFARASAWEARLRPGDVLFIPKYWWHCVHAVSASVNLSTWFHHRDEVSPWRALAGAPLSFRACAALAAELKRRRLLRLATAGRLVWRAAFARRARRATPQPRSDLLDE